MRLHGNLIIVLVLFKYITSLVKHGRYWRC